MSERRGPWNSLSQIVGRIEDLESAVSAILELDWQNSVLSQFDPTAALPVGPSTGDRYIATATANGWTDTYIYEWSGTAWTEGIPNEGWATWVEDENKVYVFDGAAWVSIGSTTDHNLLSNLQGGTASEYYHLTQAIHDALYSGSPIIGMGAVAGTNVEVDYGNHVVTIDLDGEAGLVATKDGAVELYYDGVKVLSTLSSGVNPDGVTIHYNGLSSIYTNIFQNSFGNQYFDSRAAGQSSGFFFRANDALDVLKNVIFANTSGVTLYHNNENIFKTAPDGIWVLDGGGGTDPRIGFYTDTESQVAEIQIVSRVMHLMADDSGSLSTDILVGDPDGAVELYYDGVKTFETTAVGADFFGATANSQLVVREGSSGN